MPSRPMVLALFAGLMVAASLSLVATAAKRGYTVEPLKEAPPAEVTEGLRELLGKDALRVIDKRKKPFVDLWLRKSVAPVEAKAVLGVKFGQLEEGTVVGVARFNKNGKDFKGNTIPPGLYTLRNGLQPVDGDHQGASDTRDFLLVSPVKEDKELTPLPTDKVVELSEKVTGSKHPTVLWLTKVFDKKPKLPRMVEDEDLGLWSLECELGSEGQKDPLRLGIVLVGQAPDF